MTNKYVKYNKTKFLEKRLEEIKKAVTILRQYCPLERDNQGQIIIYTGLQYDTNGELVELKEDD